MNKKEAGMKSNHNAVITRKWPQFAFLLMCFLRVYANAPEGPPATIIFWNPYKKSSKIVSDQHPEMGGHVEKIDPMVQFRLLTQELAEELGAEKYLQNSPEFSQWVISFNKIPGKAPHSIQEQRVFLQEYDTFKPLQDAPQVSQILKAQTLGEPVHMIVNACGYLLGEKVTWRLVSKNPILFKEIVFYPRPLVLKKSSGEVLAWGELVSHGLDETTYIVDLCGIGKKEQCELIARFGDGTISSEVFQGNVAMLISPNVEESQGGVGHLELRLGDGSSYTMKFPWGLELLEYSKGRK